ncbi:hypothetical protein GCM10011515_21320 [Tsuneonella deserti]|uniref:DUF2155 domain-containing protein n=1 Tax=Tsuneonella deserti TaxID=2035528 RepID=A0ABQ1SBF6_9SPHN|nr:hypothetical protein GCM10011515_21320 [Tsuneonella deserti]
MRAGATMLIPALAALAACSKGPPPPRAVETEIPENLRAPTTVRPVDAGEGTPMKDRIAVIGVLNKRNNLSQDFQMKPGEAKRWGDVIVRLAACERTAPWEFPRQTGAFAQVFVRGARDNDSWNKVFSGWLFKESPSLNVVEHPIYDVWVKDCKMSFDGGKPKPEASSSSAPKASGSEAAPMPSASASKAT